MVSRLSRTIMGRRDFINRSAGASDSIELTEGLFERLTRLAIQQSRTKFSSALKGCLTLHDVEPDRVLTHLREARRHGLSNRDGGIHEYDFVNLSVLSELLRPALYVESGVFIGSSLFAFHRSAWVRKIIAIDPRIEAVTFRDEDVERTSYIGDQDFCQIDFPAYKGSSLVYFDDHINTADRIEDAYEKGFKVLVFDDSFGVTGTTRQMFPATPTLPMIMGVDQLEEGDRLSWPSGKNTLSITFTREMLGEMRRARDKVAQVLRFPDLLDFMAHPANARFVPGRKSLVLLK